MLIPRLVVHASTSERNPDLLRAKPKATRAWLPTPEAISWGSRLMRATVALGFLWAFGFAQTASAQTVTTPCTPTSLCLHDNYLVTGDYVVGGVGLRGLGDPTSLLASGTITIPDPMQPNSTSVPNGADIVAAFLYWETVESTLQGAPTGKQGFFNGYSITGTLLGNPNAPTSWSSGGCSGNSQGSKTMVAYREDVRPFLNLDANGKALGNGSYQVSLADSGSNGGGTPLTMGATLVVIYRVLSPAVPLNSIVLYDGALAPNNATSTMTQPIVGFYQAGPPPSPAPPFPVAKITHIAGNGQQNKSESVFLNGVNLPSLYTGKPPLPGIYNGSWDNATWLPNNYPPIDTAVLANAFTVTTSVVPNGSGGGCVNWGAVIFSTTVQDTDGDGLLDVWEDNQGYTDAKNGQWVALPGADKSLKDIFVEIDYLSNLDLSASSFAHSHLPKLAALDMVGDAFCARSPITLKCTRTQLHFDLGPGIYQGDPYVITYPVPTPQGVTTFPGAGGNAISEGALLCTDNGTPPLCAFPGTPTVPWKGGFLFVRNNATVPSSNPAVPLGNFQPGRKDSYHYVLFGHSLGESRTSWSANGKAPNLTGSGLATLVSIDVNNGVGTVTLTTPSGLLKPGDAACTDANCDRVTVQGALKLANKALNGTYKFLSAPSSTFDGTTNMFTTMFTIQTTGVANGTYDFFSEPQLGLTFGGPTSTSGHSDFGGGADSAAMFGGWPADDAPGCQADPSLGGQVLCDNEVGNVQQQAGTLMHEMGHTLTLTHGGAYYNDSQNPSVATYELNCKPNFLSVMSYLFQIRGFPDGGIDYSGQIFSPLDETNLSESAGIGPDSQNSSALHLTRWYAPPNALDIQLQSTVGGRFATRHCDGTPIGANEPPAVRVDGGLSSAPGSTFSAPLNWNNDAIVPDPVNPQDANFNGLIGDLPFSGFNDWQTVDLRQMGARAGAFGFSGGGGNQYGSGGNQFGSGGNQFGSGGNQFGSGGIDQDQNTACSTADPPTKLTADVSGKSVVLKWKAPNGPCQVRRYDVLRATGSFTTLASVLANLALFTDITAPKGITGTPPVTTFTDSNVKNNTTYTYLVTETNAQGAQSGQSNPPTTKLVLFSTK